MERLGSKPVFGALVLELVAGDAVTARWTRIERVFTAAYMAKAIMGYANSRHTAAFRFLASGFLGMDRGRRGVCISLRGGSFDAAASSGAPSLIASLCPLG